ncbi:MAG: glycine--tRNA ligase [Candidatus Hydrothermarchaeales archaeon]
MLKEGIGDWMDRHKKVMELAKRRGFIWPSFDIYGGVSGFYDFGPLGAGIKKKVEDRWREFFVIGEGFLEVSTPTIGIEDVFVASGHVSSFVDPMVECQECGEAYRADHLIQAVVKDVAADGLSFEELEDIIRKSDIKCPTCDGKLGGVWSYNLMFKTHVGPGKKKLGYLRPETAQGIFISFPRLYRFYRKRLPFGIAQIGRAYRNEISPRQGVIRLREFTQAELEVFVHPNEKTHKDFDGFSEEVINLLPKDGVERQMTAKEAVEGGVICHELLTYYLVLTQRFLEYIGIPKDKIRSRQHAETEIAHYAADCWDVEVLTDRFGWIEVVGVADRTDYDLKAHMKLTGVDLNAFEEFEEPRVVEKTVLEPDMSKIGPRYKDKAGEIIAAVENLSEEEIGSFENNGFVDLKIGNETLRLDEELLNPKKVKETVVGEKFVPHIIEPSFGIDRMVYCILESAYNERLDRVVMSFKNSVVPIEVAIFPLVPKSKLPKVAREIWGTLKGNNFLTIYDEADSIGRRYARVDEIGVPYAITVDFETLEDNTVTLRERDSTEQVRMKIDELPEILRDLLGEKMSFEDLR